MICKGCGEEKKLVKSHIIPESFFKGLRGEKYAPKLLSNTEGVYPKKSPNGVYDKEILCHQCESIFQELDDFGYKELIQKEENQEKLYHENKLAGYRINNTDPNLLKLFFISVLWRASISGHYFYSKVNLGKLENSAKDLIWAKNPGGIHDFSFVLAKFDDDGAGRTIMDPHTERWFNVRYYRIYMFGYVLYIKSDSQKTPKKWEKFISQDENLIIVSRGISENSKEHPLLVKTAKMNAKRT